MMESNDKDKNPESTENQVESILAHNLGFIYGKGYEWVTANIVPISLGYIDSHTKQSVASDQQSAALCVLGDIHEFNDAYLASILFYKRALEVDDSNLEARWNLGDAYGGVGERQACSKLILECHEMDPLHEYAVVDEEEVQEMIAGSQVIVAEFDHWWRMQELISIEMPELALALIGEDESSKANLFRARAYGVLGDAELAIREWLRLCDKKDRFRLRNTDWYYMSDAVEDTVELWEQLHGQSDRADEVVNCEAEDGSKFSMKWSDYCKYMVAVITNDDHVMAKFRAMYPGLS